MPGRDRLWRPRTPSIADLLAAGERPLFSFEFFPPKDEIQQRQLWQAVRELESLGPDFVSVTYGASGSTRDRTIKATEAISQHTTLRAMAHLLQPPVQMPFFHPELRNPVPQQPADAVGPFIHRDQMPGPGQLLGARQARRARADHSDGLARQTARRPRHDITEIPRPVSDRGLELLYKRSSS